MHQRLHIFLNKILNFVSVSVCCVWRIPQDFEWFCLHQREWAQLQPQCCLTSKHDEVECPAILIVWWECLVNKNERKISHNIPNSLPKIKKHEKSQPQSNRKDTSNTRRIFKLTEKDTALTSAPWWMSTSTRASEDGCIAAMCSAVWKHKESSATTLIVWGIHTHIHTHSHSHSHTHAHTREGGEGTGDKKDREINTSIDCSAHTGRLTICDRQTIHRQTIHRQISTLQMTLWVVITLKKIQRIVSKERRKELK